MELQRQTTESSKADILVRPLRETDLATADHIMRLAFGTFIGLPEPTTFMGDAAMVQTRWLADPTAPTGRKPMVHLSVQILPPIGAAWASSVH